MAAPVPPAAAGPAPVAEAVPRGQQVRPAAAVDDRGRPVAPEPAATQAGKPGRRWALLIGCNTFALDGVPPLAWCETDVADLERVLVKEQRGLFDDGCVVTLSGVRATTPDIERAIKRIAKEAAEGDFVFVFYAGHGALDPAGGLGGLLEPYLVGYNSDPSLLKSSALSFREFLGGLLECRARQVTVFMDACHSGAARQQLADSAPRPRSFVSSDMAGRPKGEVDRMAYRQVQATPLSGRCLVVACREDEVAFEYPDLRNGLMAHYLKKALTGEADDDGNQVVTLQEAFSYLVDRVSEQTRARKSPPQTPMKYEATSEAASAALAFLVSDSGSVQERALARRVLGLSERIQSGDWSEAGGLERDIEAFLKEHPSHRFATTARRAMERRHYQLLREAVARLPGDVGDEAQLAAWKTGALDLLAAYEKRFPGGSYQSALQSWAREIEAMGKEIPDAHARVRIPGGAFDMGRAHGGDLCEGPPVRIELSPFEIDRFEVSNRRFREFVAAGGYEKRDLWSDEGWDWRKKNQVTEPAFWNDSVLGKQHGNAPVVGVGWHEAEAFARFVGKGARLPTEAEWERAARGGDGREYPWGDGVCAQPGGGAFFACCDAGNGNGGAAAPVSIELFPTDVTAEGCRHMAGNVSEWCADTFNAFYYRRTGDRTNPVCREARASRVIRGGAWSRGPLYLSTTQRDWGDPGLRAGYVGFRLAYDIQTPVAPETRPGPAKEPQKEKKR